MRLSLVCHAPSNYSPADIYGSSELDQISGRKELDEGPATTEGSAPETDEDLVDDDGPWYMGKAREEFNRRMRDAAAPGDDEDPVQVCNLSQLYTRLTSKIVSVGSRSSQRGTRSGQRFWTRRHVRRCSEGRAPGRGRCGRVCRDDGARGALPYCLVAAVHPREMGRKVASGGAATEATLGATRGAAATG